MDEQNQVQADQVDDGENDGSGVVQKVEETDSEQVAPQEPVQEPAPVEPQPVTSDPADLTPPKEPSQPTSPEGDSN
jgi:hypothetical protein